MAWAHHSLATFSLSRALSLPCQVKALYVPLQGSKRKPPTMLVPFIRHLHFLPVAQVRTLLAASLGPCAQVETLKITHQYQC